MSRLNVPSPEAFLTPQPVALYRHVDESGELLYIGITSSPARRWQQHLEASFWSVFVDDTSIVWLESRAKARGAERRAIRRDKPLFNRERPAGSSQLLDHQRAYLQTGVSGLFRRVRCRSFPAEFCIACGPDGDRWYDSLTFENTSPREYVA